MHRFGGHTKAGLPTAFVARRLSLVAYARPCRVKLERRRLCRGCATAHEQACASVLRRTQCEVTGALARPRSREARGRAVFDLYPHRCRTQPNACKHTG
jgi:hypothetical protein